MNEARAQSAAYLNRLSGDELFTRFAITRIARIDGLDCIGVPVYSSIRPASRSISVNSGKSQQALLARAGAIAEAIEFHTFEQHPKWFEEGPIGWDSGLPTHKNSEWTPETSVVLEEVTHWKSGAQMAFPAELVWMTRRADQNNFMRSTTGQAVGSSFEEAFLAGLYEVVERDQATLQRTTLLRRGVYPSRVAIPESLHPLVAKISQAGLCLYLLSCSQDINIPVFWVLLVHPWGGAGAYFGYGCNLSAHVAAERAILEAIQGRCVYISGARDDILRRDFLKQRNVDPRLFLRELEPLFIHPFQNPHWSEFDLTPQQELTRVLNRLQRWHEGIYYKRIDLGDMTAVKAIILGLECPSICEEEIWREQRWSEVVSRIIYVGPSLYPDKAEDLRAPHEIWKGPAAQGEILRDIQRFRPRQILLIDGVFHQSLAVWHKELVWALLEGVVCIGAASMGALRASELHRYGMIGVGQIFERYRDGEEDDALVAMTFDPETYRPIREAPVGNDQKRRDALLAIEFARSYSGEVETTLDRTAETPYLQDVLKRILAE